MHIARPDRRRRVMTLTPLIDVVFLLLIFFMLATTFLETRQVQVAVPRLGGGEGGAADAISISVETGGTIEINGRQVPLAGLTAAIRRALKDAPDQIVQIFPQKDVPLQRLVSILDQVRAAGARNIALERRVLRGGGGNRGGGNR